MNYKRNCIVLGIILIISIIMVGIYKIRMESKITRDIEAQLGFSNEEKNNINYKELIKDIKSVNSKGKLKYAKVANGGNSSEGGAIKLTLNGSSYQGDGYRVEKVQLEKSSEYRFYKEDVLVYSASEEDNNRAIKNIALYGIIVVMIILEGLFFYKYKFKK